MIDNIVAFCIAGVALVIFALLAIVASTYRQRRKYSIPVARAISGMDLTFSVSLRSFAAFIARKIQSLRWRRSRRCRFMASCLISRATLACAVGPTAARHGESALDAACPRRSRARGLPPSGRRRGRRMGQSCMTQRTPSPATKRNGAAKAAFASGGKSPTGSRRRSAGRRVLRSRSYQLQPQDGPSGRLIARSPSEG